ncbi:MULTISPECIES: substrate-binding periplasmic protein [Kordiimonas]|uniref:substrate-binding periplasmic protein n=1 Tax=Kordiimonas TaxID=288021 RepID=UPI002580A93A|nr:transporter substrate-binding domain-containing protein [Kordiimonas sp. UBA4487]
MFAAFATAAMIVAVEPAPDAVRLTLYTEENPPFNFFSENTGKIEGTVHAVVTEMMRRAGFSYQVELLPWKRAFQTAQETSNACLYSVDRTEEREALFQWVSPIFESGWYLHRRPDSDIEIMSLADITPYRVSATFDYASTRELMAQGHQDILMTQTSIDALRLLYRGRVDLLLTGELEAKHLSKKAGLPEPIPVLKLGTAISSMGCSLTTDPVIVQKLQEINDGMATFKARVLGEPAGD